MIYMFRKEPLDLCFLQTMNAFYERIGNPDNNGAAFFAVCRGKVNLIREMT